MNGLDDTRYTLSINNGAPEHLDFCVFEAPPSNGSPSVRATAWQVRSLVPGAEEAVSWTNEYGFIWTERDRLAEAATVDEWQPWPASLVDPTRAQVELDYEEGAFTFKQTAAVHDPKPGTLYITTTQRVPPNRAWIGIARAGWPLRVTRAEPLGLVEFTPHGNAGLAVMAAPPGSWTQGGVLDLDDVPSSPYLVTFDEGVTERTLTFDGMTWAPEPKPPDGE